jgi:hypothetical protein
MSAVLRTAASGTLAALLSAVAGAEPRCGPDAAADASIRLEYAVTATRPPLALSGDGVVTYQRSGDRYRMTSSLRALGLFEARQESEGVVGGRGLVPHRFSHRSGNRPPHTVDFDWQAGRVTFGPSGTSEPIRDRMQDRLSLLLQLSWLHHADSGAGRIEVPVAGRGRSSAYDFVARGAETLDLPGGRFETIRFERTRERGGEVLEVWLATRLCSLPVQVRFTGDGGLVVEQRLRSAHPPVP